MAYIRKHIKADGSRTYTAIVKRHGKIVARKTFPKQTLAKQWATELEADKDRIEFLLSPTNTITIDQVIDEYSRYVLPGLRDQNRPSSLKWWREQIGHIRLADLDTKTIREHLNAYKNGQARSYQGRNLDGTPIMKTLKRPRSPASYNRMRAALGAVLNYAKDEADIIVDGEIITREPYLKGGSPMKDVRVLKENNQHVRFLDDDERTRLLEAAKTCSWDKMRLLILMAIMTGGRKSELLGITWDQIDWENRRYFLEVTKNGEKRFLNFPPNLIEELKKHREVGNGLVFPSPRKPGKPYDFTKVWRQLLKDADIQNFRWHDLRHTAASYFVQNGKTLEETAQHLGHQDPKTTKRYAHLDDGTKQRNADDVAAKIFG